MRQLTARHVEAATAVLIGLYVFDLPRLIIDIWGLPLPLLGGRPPYLFPFAAIAAAALVSVAVRKGQGWRDLIQPVDFLFLSAFTLCAMLAVMHDAPGSARFFGVIVDLAVFYSGYLLARYYTGVFGDMARLLECLYLLALGIAGFHAALLVLYFADLPLLGARPAEFVQRNGISYLLVFACFYVWFLASRRGILVSHVILPALTLSHIWLNSARGAFVAFAILAAARFLLRADRSLAGSRLGLAGALIALILVVVGLPVFEIIRTTALGPTALGLGDDELSALSRLATNYGLLQELSTSPLIGVGEAIIGQVRFAGYMSHTFPLIVISAYGTLGAAPLLVSLAMMVGGADSDGCVANSTLVLLVAVTLFVNDLWPWLGTAVAAASVSGRGIPASIEPSAKLQRI